MKPFDLEKALAGEPVKLRNGSKAILYANLSNCCKSKYPLKGLIYSEDEQAFIDKSDFNWTIEGKHYADDENLYDIVGMWEEPRPTVTLTLPCPLKEPQYEMWFINANRVVAKSKYYDCTQMEDYDLDYFKRGFYFASQEDAQAWLDAMKNNRR